MTKKKLVEQCIEPLIKKLIELKNDNRYEGKTGLEITKKTTKEEEEKVEEGEFE